MLPLDTNRSVAADTTTPLLAVAHANIQCG